MIPTASELLHTAWSFAILLAAFLPLELLFAARRQPVLRPAFLTDALYFAGQYLLWNAPVVAFLLWLHTRLATLPIDGLRQTFASWPWAVQFLIAIALSDFCTYWGHRWQHHSPFLWRFHRVHHTAEHLDWLAAHREHPLDNLWTRTVENLPLLVLGFPLATIAGFAVFRGLWAVFIHSNCTLSPGPLRVLLGAPRLHHWHHAIEGGGRVNFANLSPLMDVMFGTWHDPGRMPDRIGLTEPYARSYLGALVEPLLPKRPRRG
ncbi:MAG: sterol desaturase family protein [Planctomycetes bacterium]|jgi:sterol desaturase/sphingolipid hydroxylase (fatty acid hydroxylase superfamily)|nr:sterol desaturase family protein [Planctomycetota bacterium]